MGDREAANEGNLTNISKSGYEAHYDNSLMVCICPTTNPTGKCGCMPAAGFPSGIQRYDASTCIRECSGTTSTWVAVEPGYCMQLPNDAVHNYRNYLGFYQFHEARRYGSKYACEHDLRGGMS
jgi:hypothetical protein